MSKKKNITINIDMDANSDQQALKDLIEQGNKVANLLKDPILQKSQGLDIQIEDVRSKIQALKDKV